jgi:hypothetical protein
MGFWKVEAFFVESFCVIAVIIKKFKKIIVVHGEQI